MFKSVDWQPVSFGSNPNLYMILFLLLFFLYQTVSPHSFSVYKYSAQVTSQWRQQGKKVDYILKNTVYVKLHEAQECTRLSVSYQVNFNRSVIFYFDCGLGGGSLMKQKTIEWLIHFPTFIKYACYELLSLLMTRLSSIVVECSLHEPRVQSNLTICIWTKSPDPEHV